MPLSKVEREELLPYWQVFIHEALTGTALADTARALRIQRGGTPPANSRDESLAGYLRHAFRTGLPAANTLWKVALAAQSAGVHWFAGPLLLFAGGRFAEFVRVMSTASALGVPTDRLIEMLHSVEAATTTSQPSAEEFSAHQSHQAYLRQGNAGRAKRAANRFARARRARLAAWRAGREPAERRIWTCTPAEERIFQAAWTSPNPYAENPYIAAAVAALSKPAFGRELRVSIAVTLLLGFLEA